MERYNKKIIKTTLENFKYNFKDSIVFEMFYKLITWFIFIPINYLILNSFMKRMGVYNITNKQIIKFALTYQGIIYITIMVILSFMAIFIELTVLIYISNKSHTHERESLIKSISNSLKGVNKFPSIYVIIPIFISMIIGPLTGVKLYNSLIRNLSIPGFVKKQLGRWEFGEIIFWIFIILMIISLLRWILVIPIMIIEKVPLKIAVKYSKDVYKKNGFKIFLYIVGWSLINYGLKLFLLGGCVGVGVFFILALEGKAFLQEIITNFGLIIFFIGYVSITIITLPIFISFLVELYYKFAPSNLSKTNFISEVKGENNTKYNRITEKIFNFLVIGIFIFVIGILGFSIVFNNVVEKDINITAHRGSSLRAPENSISAILEAIIQGADYAEIDVMTTLDNEVVLFHDNTLRRFDGTDRKIKNLTMKEVRRIDIGSHFSEDFKGEGIPTLEEVLNLCENNIKLNIELKAKKKHDKLAELVANMITERGLEDKVIISSQSYESLQKVKEINPLIDVGFIVTFGIGDFTKLDVDFISIEHRMASRELVYKMHALDKEVHVWTINEKKKAEDMIKLGVDNIITDNVGLLQRIKVSIEEKDDVSYINRFLDGITSLVKYAKI